MTYVPKRRPYKQAGINNDDGEYEGIWSGPKLVPVDQIKRSHHTSHLTPVAKGYEDKPIRIQPWPSDNYTYRIVDGNKRLAKAKRLGQHEIWAYVFVDRYYPQDQPCQ